MVEVSFWVQRAEQKEGTYWGPALWRILEPLVARVVGLSSPINSVGILVVNVHIHGGRAKNLFDEGYEIRRGLKIHSFRVFVRFRMWNKDIVRGWSCCSGSSGLFGVRKTGERVFYGKF